MTHQNTETLKQWFAEQVEFAKSTVEYWQELATIARGDVVALQARVKELEAQKSVLKEQRDMAKDELSMHGGTLVERIRKLKDEWAKIHRERDHANMVADAAAEKIKDLEALAKARAVGRKD